MYHINNLQHDMKNSAMSKNVKLDPLIHSLRSLLKDLTKPLFSHMSL